MNAEGLDKLDSRILEVIKDNARMSYSDIGDLVGLSRVAVKNRMEAMEKAGGYTYARLTKAGIVHEQSNMYNPNITKSADMAPVTFNIIGGPTIGYTGSQFSRKYDYSPERSLDCLAVKLLQSMISGSRT